MSSEALDNTFNWHGGFQTQHKVPLELQTSDIADAAREFLTSIGFDFEAEGNKMGVLTNTAVRDAILNGPQSVRDALKTAGIGLNVQNGSHPGYTAFVIEALNRLQVSAEAGNWTQEDRVRAFLKFDDFLDTVNFDPHPPVMGSSKEDFLNLWNIHAGPADLPSLSDQEVLDRFQSLQGNPIDANANNNSQMRYKMVSALYDATDGVLTPAQWPAPMGWSGFNLNA